MNMEVKLQDLLVDMVRTVSVNPPGNEAAVAERIVREFDSDAWSVRILEGQPNRPNVVATFDTQREGPTLIFNGHMDTLPPGSGYLGDPFSGHIEDGQLYGRGSLDMKAGVAAMVRAAISAADAGDVTRGRLVVACVADETSGGTVGTGYLVSSGHLTGDAAVVCEPTGSTVRLAHRGCLWLDVTLYGESAHGGRPWLGRNAIVAAAELIVRLESQLPEVFARTTHPLVPSPTLNVGTIHGGDKPNLVADKCVISLDRRLVPGETFDTAEAQIVAVVEELLKDRPGFFSYDVERRLEVNSAEINPDARIVRECAAAYREVTGDDPAMSATAGFEDAHYLLDAGIETVMFGPYGREDTASDTETHTTKSGSNSESVSLAETLETVEIYRRIIRSYLGA
ncbi:M20 family metallopeptidase [Streptomyces sp. NPDC001508]|uniref:M20 family metallopeptidase n=1 Tax=Streptomyces sp. NPDC001508 TaxID=3154656 RepID=UPI00332CB8D5